MRDFDLVFPLEPKKLKIESLPLEDISLKLQRLGNIKKGYEPKPTTSQWNALGDSKPLQRVYTQHRQEDWGRAIALNLDSRNILLSSDNGRYIFQNYEKKSKGVPDIYKIYAFDWNGEGNSPNDIIFPNSYSTLFNYPHKYQWAAWFLVKGFPEIWLPDSSFFPEIAPWVSY